MVGWVRVLAVHPDNLEFKPLGHTHVYMACVHLHKYTYRLDKCRKIYTIVFANTIFLFLIINQNYMAITILEVH